MSGTELKQPGFCKLLRPEGTNSGASEAKGETRYILSMSANNRMVDSAW